MKIATFFELDSGGARRGANEFAKAFKQMGHLVDLFCVDMQKNENEAQYYSAIHLYRFSPVQWSGGNWKARLYRDTIELYTLYRLHARIAQDIDRKKYDVVLVHPSKFTQAPWILRFLKTPTLYYCQEPLRLVYDPLFAIPTNLSFGRKMYEFLSRRLRKITDASNMHHPSVIFANSTYTKRNIQKAHGMHSDVCHMGVDTARFYPSAKKSVDLLFIGTRDADEGYSLFQESVALMKNKPKIMELIRGENWATTDDELRRFYSQARIVICFASHEPFGLIPLEAMACGSVVVAVNEGGYKDSVQNGKTGMLVEKEPKKIAKVLDSLLKNTSSLTKISQRAQKEMKEHWQWSRGAKHIISVAAKMRGYRTHPQSPLY